MNTPPVELLLSRIRAHTYVDGKGSMLKPTPRGWESRCPAHPDRMPSLGIAQGDRGDALLKCAAGCPLEHITAALGLAVKDLFMPSTQASHSPAKPERKARKTHPTLTDALSAAQYGQAMRLELPKDQLLPAGKWEYHNADGKVVAVVARFNVPAAKGEKPTKQFSPIAAVPGGWQVGDPPGGRWPLYRLADVTKAVKQTGRLWWCEGEKAADAAARALGLCITTTAHGSKSPQMTDFTPLTGIDEVIITPDNDGSGQKYADDIACRVLAVAPLAKVRIIQLPHLPPKGDWVEYLASWGDAPVDAIYAELEELVQKSLLITTPTPPPAPAPETKPPIIVKEQEPIIPTTPPEEAAKQGEPWILRDLGNAHRFLHLHREKVRYDCRRGCWRIWDGKHWKADENQTAVYELATLTVRSLFQEAQLCPVTHISQEIAKWASKSFDRVKLENMLALASRLTDICPAATLWDADAYAFTCANGTIDLRTASLGPHEPRQLITAQSPATFDPDASSDLLLHSLADWHSDVETVLFLQMAAGYSLTGDISEEKMFLLHGPPAAGKSTFIEMMKMVLGDYSRTASFESFLKKNHANGSGPSSDIARLAGARLVTAVESEEGKEIAEGLVKGLTGGDTITARFLHKNEFEFRPQFKLWLASNHPPQIDVDDAGMWRRLIKVPFTKSFMGKMDKTVKSRLMDVQETGSAFLAWAVMGCQLWLQEGLKVPDVLNKATADLREEMDVASDFFEECLDFNTLYTCTLTDILQKYDDWCTTRRMPANRRMGSRKLSTKLKSRGCTPQVNNSHRWWQGVGIK